MTASRLLRLAVLLSGVLALVCGVAPVSAAPTASAAGGRRGGDGGQISILITSLSRDFATPGRRVVVSGVIVNSTAGAAPGPLWVRLWSSSTPLADTAAMNAYLGTDGIGLDQLVAGAQPALIASLPAHSTRPWHVTLPASAVGMQAFGVYPLAVQLEQNGSQLAAARTFLPFWPGRSRARMIKPVSMAWIWPVMATPQHAACPGLLSDSLAANIAPGGRLGRLLAAGTTATARQAQLTWAIDPGLLADVATMTTPYQVGSTPTCADGSSRPASARARSWLARIKAAAAHQDFFVTPYDDVDVAALAHWRGLGAELKSAFVNAHATAQEMLGQSQRTTVSGKRGAAAGQGLGVIAWPPDGIADYGVLENLAANGVGTVILSSAMMPPLDPRAALAAVTTTPNGMGTQPLHVLLANSGLTQILATPQARIPGAIAGVAPATPGAAAALTSSAAGAQAADFAREQWFLAQTAMIAAQAPTTARSLVVAPPRRWDPSARLARTLLAETVGTPWLRPAGVGSLVAHTPATGQLKLQPPPSHRVGRIELRHSLLKQVRRLAALLRLAGSIRVPSQASQYQSTALAAVESSAWRGDRANQAKARRLLRRIQEYVSHQFQQVAIVDSGRVTLTGKSGAVPVSITNRLPYPVDLGLQVLVPKGTGVSIGQYQHTVRIAAGTGRTATSHTIKIPLQTQAAGPVTLTLRLTTPDGKPLPGPPATLTVEATHFGSLAIVIIAVGLLIFVVTAVARAIRRGGRPGTQNETPTGPTPADTVEPGLADDAPSSKESDDHASTEDWSGQTPR